nr:RAMP superfamily CRISPR-associated protein [Candidatus Njordarchaeota archaeon]
MVEPKCFGKYVLLSQMDAKIVAKTPLRVGKGRELEISASDLPIIKNAEDAPILPGSSLKGFFRANAERILINMFESKPEKAAQIIRKIFGSSEQKENASGIFFNDLKATSYKIENRKHISISPETGGVTNLFEVECVMDGAVFEGSLATTRNLSPSYIGILQPVLELSALGVSRLGGFKSRGYGLVDVTINKLTIVIPGKPIGKVRQGIDIQPTIGTNKPTHIEVKEGNNVKLSEIDEVSFTSRVEEAPSYLGTKLIVDNPTEVSKLLSSLANQLQKFLSQGD